LQTNKVDAEIYDLGFFFSRQNNTSQKSAGVFSNEDAPAFFIGVKAPK